MTSRWGEETTLKFVQEYRDRECLWNTALPIYKNKQARDAAYKQIEEIMGIEGSGVHEIKNKIRTLRSTYSQELKKVNDSKKSGTGTDSVYVSPLKWFHEMKEFLHVEGRKRQTEENFTEEIDESNKSIDEDSQKSADVTQSKDAKILPPPRRRTKMQQMTAIVHDLKNISQTANKESVDEYDIFGQSVAAQLKHLSKYNAIRAQDKIQSILTSFKLLDIRSSSPSSPNNNCVSQSSPTYSCMSQPSSGYSCISQPRYSSSLQPSTPYNDISEPSPEYINAPQPSPLCVSIPESSPVYTTMTYSSSSETRTANTTDVLAQALSNIEY